jgi:2-polyprenyl-3-methyl-5-hydroxy-6-metoxy-1,4-benzoquinol methylase
MSESEEIKQRYERRKSSDLVQRNQHNLLYAAYITEEREKIYKEILQAEFPDLSGKTLLEIGAGNGSNLLFFQSIGLKEDNIYANELLDDRLRELRKKIKEDRIFAGNILEVNTDIKFDIVFQSTVFSSVLDPQVRVAIADKMMQLLKPGGIILWYDFIYNNPRNPDVRKVTRKEVRQLFPDCNIRFRSVTLAPPVGRRIGKAYKFINFIFPFLRSHIIALIQKK